MLKFKLGGVYRVEFWDHALNSGAHTGPLMCEVFGRVIHTDGVYVELATWLCQGDEEQVNKESIAIIKSAIVRAKKLK